MKRDTILRTVLDLALILMLAPLTAATVAAQGTAPARVLLPTNRTVLPIPEPKNPHSTVLDARNATPPPRFEVKAPANAPNVLIVLPAYHQYFEIFGNRSIYHDGWLAGTVHRAGWEFKVRRPLENDIWELYDTRTDFSLANDLAANNPAKLKELQDLFMTEAVKYSVLPLDDRLQERFVAALVGRPDLMAGRTSLTVFQGMKGMSENVFINLKNKSHTITAEVEIPKKGANGVILAQASRFGGWSFYLKDGKPTYTYNWLGLQRYTVAATQAVAAGKATLRFDFASDGGGLGKGGMGTLFVNGKKVAAGRIEKTQFAVFSADEGADVGADEGTPVTEAYKVPFTFTGKIAKVTIELRGMKAADKEEAEQSHKEAALKIGPSD